jgi:hypothetical protein
MRTPQFRLKTFVLSARMGTKVAYGNLAMYAQMGIT